MKSIQSNLNRQKYFESKINILKPEAHFKHFTVKVANCLEYVIKF